MSWGKCPYCGYEGYHRVYHWGTQELQCEKCFGDFPYDPKYDKQKKEQEKLEKEQQRRQQEQQQEQQNQQGQVDKDKAEKELVDKMRQPAIDMPLLNYRQGLARSPFSIPDESVSGLIKFAETENDIPVGFDPENELHMLIVGEPGTGKTTVANFLIAPQAMEQGIKCWFFVKARDTERLLHRNEDIVTVDFDGQIKVNILQSPPNVSREVWHSSLWDIFAQAEAVYDGTKNFLIGNCFDLAEEYKKFKAEPSMFELNDFVASRRYEPRSRDSAYQDSTLNRFAGILKGPMGGFLDCSKGCLEQLVDENVIFNIGGLPSSQQVFIVNALVSWLFLYK
ncbi:MAG: hypothetical protein NT001_03515, partial [Candidatus Woesearchaeota archaeon]|nr:hypothetical protein [Candidatus Woesearchaeota archaeon]